MIDWMLLVFHSFKKSSVNTFFRAVTMMDSVFVHQAEAGVEMSKGDLHLYGLTSIFMSSKLEDIDAITLHQIVNTAGHNKFPRDRILECERHIL
jgi:hypothetical protein